MSYFNNPKTIEELEQQCKQALIKNNYRTNDAARIAIMNEYQSLKRKITINKVSGEINEILDEQIAKTQAEERRVAQLKNAKYSDKDIAMLFNDCKKCIDIILQKMAKENQTLYMALHNSMFRYDCEIVCRQFNRRHHSFGSANISKIYDERREKLEYALKSRGQTASAKEKSMLQLETMLGKYMVETYTKYEDEYGDVFEIAKRMSSTDREKRHFDFIDRGLSLASIFLPIVFFISVIVTTPKTPEFMLLGLFLSVGLFIFIRLLLKFQRWCRGMDRKAIGDYGFSRKRSRMSEKKEYRKENAIKKLLWFFFS